MADYEYGRIRVLESKLREAGISDEIISRVMDGGENIKKSNKPVVKAEWMKNAMAKMDQLIDIDIRRSVRESCACCLGGKRLEISKKIAKTCQSLEERINAANDAKFVFGHSVSLEPDGRILVRFMPDDWDDNRCVCLPKADGPISATYCYCCGGHIKHHLQIALDKKLSCEVRSSVLASSGKKPCSFLYTIES